MHGTEAASAWVQRWTHLVPAGGSVLDVACGQGRHMRWFSARGYPVTGVDRSPEAIAAVAGVGRTVQADIEQGPWPFEGESFDAVVVTNYLYRPLLPNLVSCIGPGGLLLYETFAEGNEQFGRPSNLAFLLRPGELLEAVTGRLRVLAYEDLIVDEPKPAAVQRICARREG